MGDDGLDYEGSLRLTEVALMPLWQIGLSSPVGSGLLAGWHSSSVVSQQLSSSAAVLD
jgi:hypothetical protein